METAIMEKKELLLMLNQWKVRAHDEYRTQLLYLFGSYAREQAKPESDIDVLVSFLPGASLFDRVGLAQAMEEDFRRRIDLVPEGDLRPEIDYRK
jgi:hypothetical protein